VNDGPYTITEVRGDGLVYKIRHDSTGFVSNVFVGRLIPAQTREQSVDEADLPPPMTQFTRDSSDIIVQGPSSTSDTSARTEPADSGAESKDSPHISVDLEIAGEVPMDIEEESSTWEVERTFPLKKTGLPKRRKEKSSSDPKDLRHAYTDSATTRSEILKARNQNKINFLAEERNSGKHRDNPLWYRSRGVGELHPALTGRGGVRLVTPPVVPWNKLQGEDTSK
jgi:hypothetical protein